jgi:hypothetical protein
MQCKLTSTSKTVFFYYPQSYIVALDCLTQTAARILLPMMIYWGLKIGTIIIGMKRTVIISELT